MECYQSNTTQNQLVRKEHQLLEVRGRCEYTRQHGEGTHISQTRGILRGRKYRITYDLMLCRFCGNVEDHERKFCPARVAIMTDEEFVKRLVDSGWSEEDAKAELKSLDEQAEESGYDGP